MRRIPRTAIYLGLASLFTDLVAEEAALQTRGRAYGVLHLVNGIMLLPASLATGWIAQTWTLSIALQVCAGIACIAAILLSIELRKTKVTER